MADLPNNQVYLTASRKHLFADASFIRYEFVAVVREPEPPVVVEPEVFNPKHRCWCCIRSVER